MSDMTDGRRAGERWVQPITTTIFGPQWETIFGPQWEVWEPRAGEEVPTYVGVCSTPESADLLAHGPARLARQAAVIERLRAALAPFADMCSQLDRPHLNDGWPIYDELEEYWGDHLWTMGHLRAARAALADAGE